MTIRILVVDDDPGVRYTLREILAELPILVEEAGDGREALEKLDRAAYDLVIADLRMPRLDGMGLLEELRSRPRAPKVLVVTAHGSERTAVEAMKRGAYDYLPKPFEVEEILQVVERAVETVRLGAENERLRAERHLGRHLVFESPAMAQVALLVARVAPRDVTVLLGGESGTGKELVARALVDGSPRRDRPYLAFNCAALTRELAEAELFGHARGAFTGADRGRPGLLREARGGTVLLDEVTELDGAVQTKLLRVLQEGEVRPVGADRPERVDLRILAATNRDIREEVRAGRFREDLFYRLNVVEIRVPSLRERPEDVRPLARHFAERAAARFALGPPRLTEEALEALESHDWPGNVRELEHAVERATALSVRGEITREALGLDAPTPPSALTLRQRVEAFERGLVVQALRRTRGNRSQAARDLGIGRVTLLDKMKKYGVE